MNCSYRCNVYKTNEEATATGYQRHLPVLPSLEPVGERRDDSALEGHGTAQAEDKQHEEKEHGEYLKIY